MPAYKHPTSGKWYVKFYYTDYEGNTKQKKKMGFTLKREAEAFERDFLLNISYQPNMSFKAFYELYNKDTEPRIRQHTKQHRRYQYKNRIAPFFDVMPLNSITAQTVIKWQNELIAEELKPSYLSTLHRRLSAIFNHAVKFYNLKENPCHKAGSIGSLQPHDKMEFYTLEEFNSLISCVSDLKAKTAINLLYWSGIRKGELLALTWSDIDFNSSSLRINKSYQRLNGEPVITEPKTKKSIRTFTLPKQAIEQLEAYKACCYTNEPLESVFEWEKCFIEKGLQEGCKLSGVKRIRVHDLRHSHASLLIEKGFSPLLIAERLGHEKVETTLNTYSHLYPSKEGEMIEHLNNL